MTRNEFENEIRRMIDEGKCDVDENGDICFTLSQTLIITLNCYAIFNCDKIKFDNVGTKIVSLFRRGVYIGLANIADIKDIYIL